MPEGAEWVEPTHCPLCGVECEKPDATDAEVLACPEHGRLLVEAYDLEE